MVNNALMQFTDRAFLASESMASLEAVLPASMLSYIVLGFFQSLVAYSGTFVAHYHGAGKEDLCRRSYRAGLVLAGISGLLTFFALPLGGWVFETFANGEEIIARQKTYFDICTACGVFLYGQMAAQAYFTGRGQTRMVLWVNVLGNVLNVALDPFLIFGWCGCPRLGIAGAALATVLATAVQWAVLAVAAHRHTAGALSPAPRSPTPNPQPPTPNPQPPTLNSQPSTLNLLSRILRYGVPSGAYTVLNSASFTVFVFFTGRVGHIEAAVSNAVLSVCYLLFAPMEGFALGAATLVGQARGRRDEAEAMRVGVRTVALGCAFAVIASFVVLLLRRPLLMLYAPDDPAVAAEFLSAGTALFFLMTAWQVFDAADVIVSGALKGAGDTRFVMWWMLGIAFGFWLPILWFVSRIENTMPALWSTMVAYVVVLSLGSLVRWLRGSWKGIRIT